MATSQYQLRIEDAALATTLEKVLATVRNAGGKALLVGGCVRDSLLGLPAKDIDVEVYNLPTTQLITSLSKHFQIDQVGASFGVLKIQGAPIDISVPRRESRKPVNISGTQAKPHKDFEI